MNFMPAILKSNRSLRVVNSQAVREEVQARNVDIGFIESSLLPIGLARATAGYDRLAVVGKDHPWARRSIPLTAQELGHARWVLRESGSGTRTTFEAALGRQPLIALEGSSTAVLVGARRRRRRPSGSLHARYMSRARNRSPTDRAHHPRSAPAADRRMAKR